MSKRQWMVLLMLFLMYLFLGALIFYHIESRLEIEKVQRDRAERLEINALLSKHYMPMGKHNKNEIFEKLTIYCGRSVYNHTADDIEYKWDFYNSFYFAYTVVSTIGYGNLAPTNMLGRILMMFYALIGIPMNGILLTQLGEFFSQVFVTAHQKYKSYKDGKIDCPKKLTPLETGKAGLAAQIFMYLSPGFIMFIFFPAFVFSHYEGWSYDESVYYAFVTLTTIGFGDYVAGQDNTKGSGILFILYKAFLIAWISFGLGYIVMIMTFITRGMRSKKIVRIEHKLAMNLKHTQSKIWNEFNKELEYLRRVFNELQLSKVKRVYVDEYDHNIPPFNFPRSNSFPDLRNLVYGGFESGVPPYPRRRANSEVVPLDAEVTRVVSETDLQRIDKKATFATHAMIQPAELLARLVNILGYIPPPTDDDDEPSTLASGPEYGDKISDTTRRNSGWVLGSGNSEEKLFPKPRTRAVSEVRLEKPETFGQDGEWTWSGPAASRKIQEIIKARSKSEMNNSTAKDSKSRFPSLTLSKSVLPRWMRQFSPKKASSDGEPVTSTVSAHDIERPYFTHTAASSEMHSSDIAEGRSHLLEETSLADFLRALTALHVGSTLHPDEYSTKPRRKFGTAGLSNSSSKPISSLLSLFSPPHSGTQSATQSHQNTIHGRPTAGPRRYSLITAGEHDTNSPLYRRRSSTMGQPSRIRRFSLRPVATPTSTPPRYSSYLSIDDHTGPPPYSNDPFVLDCPKEPLMEKEKALGVSPPVASLGRFSLKPAQIDDPAPESSKPLRALPRWKAGLLQRHISQKNLQRHRARAFSLSDVHYEASPHTTISISPLARDSTKPVSTIPGQSDYSKRYNSKSSLSSPQKTVTIVPPESQSISSYAESKNDEPEVSSSQSAQRYETGIDFDSVSQIGTDISVPSTSSTYESSQPLRQRTSFTSTNPFAAGFYSDNSYDGEPDRESISFNDMKMNRMKRGSHVKTKSESDSSDLERTNDTRIIFQSFVEAKKHKTRGEEGTSIEGNERDVDWRRESTTSPDADNHDIISVLCQDINKLAMNLNYADEDDDDEVLSNSGNDKVQKTSVEFVQVPMEMSTPVESRTVGGQEPSAITSNIIGKDMAVCTEVKVEPAFVLGQKEDDSSKEELLTDVKVE